MNKKKNNSFSDPDEEMEIEMDRPKSTAINRDPNIFDNHASKNFGGINTAPSVFDRHTAIHTNE